MDALVAKVMGQAMNIAIRSGISITSGYAISQCSRLLQSTGGQERQELEHLQLRLESKVRIIAPAIDMIELIAARGNTTLESAVTLTKSLRWDIQSLGTKIANAAAEEEKISRGGSKAVSRQQQDVELRAIIADIQKLLGQIEDAVPLINLAITTSGVTLSTNLPVAVSPSRLLQASTFLTAGDSRYSLQATGYTQIGPAFTLSLYMLFAGHAHRPVDEEGLRSTTWKEVVHKARVKLVRVPLSNIYDMPFSTNFPGKEDSNVDFNDDLMSAEQRVNEFAYQLTIVEDLNDDRFHNFEDMDAHPTPLDDVESAGLREILPIHQVSKIFYADTGKILNISSDSETNNPVLLLKRDPNAPEPRKMLDQMNLASPWCEGVSDPASPATEGCGTGKLGLPSGLDPEWMAFEVYTDERDEDEEDKGNHSDGQRRSDSISQQSRETSVDPEVMSALSKLHLNALSSNPSTPKESDSNDRNQLVRTPYSHARKASPRHNQIFAPNIRTSLSLLEMLIRLTSLQQFQQCSHLAITDELLNFFLEESSTTGAAPGDTEERKRIRMQARSHIGFDPYDESPIKRRGEVYQERHESFDEAYQEGWSDVQSVSYSPQPSSDEPQLRSPMLLRSREHSSRSRLGSPETQSSTNTSKTSSASAQSRTATLRSGTAATRRARSSPLADQASSANVNDDTNDTPAST